MSSKHLARQRLQDATRLRHAEDQILADADRLGDQAPEILREVAESIREHRAGRAREREIAYLAEFQNSARQLASPALAEQWRHAGIPAREAADWANAGYTPAEAAHERAAGRDLADVQAQQAEQSAAVDDHAQQVREALNAASEDHRLTTRDAYILTSAAAEHGEAHTQRYAQHLLDRYHTIRNLPKIHDHAAVDPDQLHDVLEEMRRLAAAQRHHLEQTAATDSAQLAAHAALDRLAAGRQQPTAEGTAPEHARHRTAVKESEATREQ